MNALPPNPFDNPAFREEFRKELQPVNELLVKHADRLHEHSKAIERIKGIGSLLSLLWFGLVAYIKR